MITRHLAFFAALLLAAAPAFSQSRAQKSEFYLSPIFTQSDSYGSEGGTSIKTDTGYGFGLGFAYNVNAHVSWGIEGGWSSSDYRATVQPGTGNAGSPVNVNGYVESSTIRFLGTYNFFESAFTPFVTGGLGWTYIDTNVPSGPPQGVCWWYPWWGEVCGTYVPTHSTTKFSYNVALGLRQDFQQMFVRGLVSNQWVDIGSAGTTSWTQFRVDIGWRF